MACSNSMPNFKKVSPSARFRQVPPPLLVIKESCSTITQNTARSEGRLSNNATLYERIKSGWFCFLSIGGPLTPTCISQGFRDIKPQTFGIHYLDRLRSRDIIGHVTIRPTCRVDHCNQPFISHRFWDMTSYRQKNVVFTYLTLVRPKFDKVTLQVFGRC